MIKYRLRFTKSGKTRWLSQLDLARAWQRLIVRAGLPIKYTQGFSPHQKMSFGPALPVGAAGEREMLDIECEAEVDTDLMIASLNGVAPPGLQVSAARRLPPGASSLSASINAAEYRVSVDPAPPEIAAALPGALEGCLTEMGITDTKRGDDQSGWCAKSKTGSGLGHIFLRLPISIRPASVIRAAAEAAGLGIPDMEIVRTALWVIGEEEAVDPLEAGQPR